MERLTKVDGCGQNDLIRCFDCTPEKAGENLEHCGYCEEGWRKALDKLAAYEDAEQDGRLVIVPEPGDTGVNDYLEPTKVGYALKSEITKLNMRLERDPKSVSSLDYTIIAALKKALEGGTSK